MKRLLVCIALLAAVIPAGAQPPKKRIAIMNFDFSAVQTDVYSIFGNRQDVGQGIADLLVDRLVTDGRYSVIERKALDKIIAEQNFSNSDRADPNSAAKLGRLLGVDAIVIGSITQFGRDDKTTSVGGGALGGLAGRYGIGGVGKRQAKAVVRINARLINTDTGEILAVAEGHGESQRSGTSLLGSGGSAINAGGGNVDMGSRNFADTILGDAVGQAVTGVANRLENEASKLPGHVVSVSGLVADVDGTTLTLNVGSRSGLKIGDMLQVSHPGREIRDPATGKVLRRVDSSLGHVSITQVDEGSSVGTYTGAGKVQVGDTVKNAQ
ncbi:MAG TPA: CsgG/HfaB family protein [Bryobacteraceae bacterium]|jgi:curli biogenesis system outer membrane secretion channel CsgG